MKAIAIFLILSLCAGIFSDKSLSQTAKKETKIQLAILLDTSNSMDGLIDQARAQLWKIVNELALARYAGELPVLEIALYEYGNDGLPANKGYIRLVSELTTDLDKISEALFALKTNGGSEYCGQVIDQAADELKWSKSNDDLKLIFIAGNEEFTQGSYEYEKSCKKSITKGIIVNTIFCGAYEEGVRIKWKDGADLADGKYMNIDQNQKIAYIESPFDDEIVKLNEELNKTYIAYGEQGEEMQSRQIAQDANANQYSKANSVNRAVSKSSKVYKNESWDLVDASKKKDFDMDKIEKEQLPEEMKNMTKEERKKYIDDKQKQRDEIQTKINDLNAKRNEFVINKQKELNQDNTLDAVMLKTVREQAQQHKYEFVK